MGGLNAPKPAAAGAANRLQDVVALGKLDVSADTPAKHNPQEADTLIAAIRKNAREELRVMLREYRGHRFVDLRLFVQNGERVPVATAKGIAIRPENLRSVIDALLLVEIAARAEGLLP